MKRKLSKSTNRKGQAKLLTQHGYGEVLSGVVELLDTARRAVARSVNAVMTATYWEIGRRIVEYEQKGQKRAGYGEEILTRLAVDLTRRFGRGFSADNLERFRRFYLCFPDRPISATLSRKFTDEPNSHRSTQPEEETQPLTPSDLLDTLRTIGQQFPLPWSHYVLLLSRARSPEALEFYHTEALRGGWSVRQLARQIGSQFYERTALSKNKAAMLTKGVQTKPEDAVTADEEIRDPLVLEFLNLKDEYSEYELEEALIRHLEIFLLELGGDFAFVGRQRRLRIDDSWYRVDLLFFHRALRCLVIVDLKLDTLMPADIGQMHLYCNYARAHWTRPDENPPVGIILCAGKGDALVRYATEGLPNQTLVREYLTALPDEKLLAKEIEKTRKLLEERR